MDEQYIPVDSNSSVDDSDHCSMRVFPSLADQELVLQLVGLPHFSQFLSRSPSPHCSDDEPPMVQQLRDWSSTASLGEKQRIAVARLLLQHPKLVCLDHI